MFTDSKAPPARSVYTKHKERKRNPNRAKRACDDDHTNTYSMEREEGRAITLGANTKAVFHFNTISHRLKICALCCLKTTQRFSRAVWRIGTSEAGKTTACCFVFPGPAGENRKRAKDRPKENYQKNGWDITDDVGKVSW